MNSVISGKLEGLQMYTTANITTLIPATEDVIYYTEEVINNVPRINKFLINLNKELSVGERIQIKIETMHARQVRLFQKFPFLIRYFLYSIDFLLNRVLPKLSLTKSLYFSITKGKNRVISLAEILGRLYYCGFKVIEYKREGNLTLILSEKIQDPILSKNPSYGLIVKLCRVGYKGKLKTFYKLRSMHPYSEFIQEYVFHKNSLAEGGKLNNDFRITSWGKFLRALWIDEIPMSINYLKGDIKLVGVRPLSQQYFKLYPTDIQKLRTSFKPGLIPPFYADMPVTFEEIVESERKYLIQYQKNPFKTDVKYFFKAMRNILIKNVRSR